HLFPDGQHEASLLGLVRELNAERAVHGILVQLPLPGNVDEDRVISAVDPAKDVDGFHPENLGRLLVGAPTVVPGTPAGIVEILDHYGIELKGADAVVVGRSRIVGKPLAQLFLMRHATVTVCHTRTRDLPAHTRRADVLAVAAGRPGCPDVVARGGVSATESPARQVWTVSAITLLVKGTLETAFGGLWVEGEISNLRVHSSGHVYFTLKDDGAQIRAVLFRGRTR